MLVWIGAQSISYFIFSLYPLYPLYPLWWEHYKARYRSRMTILINMRGIWQGFAADFMLY